MLPKETSIAKTDVYCQNGALHGPEQRDGTALTPPEAPTASGRGFGWPPKGALGYPLLAPSVSEGTKTPTGDTA